MNSILVALLLCTSSFFTSIHFVNGENSDYTAFNDSIVEFDSSAGVLSPRQLPEGQCAQGTECWDKSCCAKSGWCGRDPDYCNADVCISNCQAKSECGRGALVPGTQCPLNVCCGPFGYCGMTPEFCDPKPPTKPCQSNCAQPGSTGQSGSDVRDLVIGYLGAWSITRRGCANREIDDIPIDSLTHLNFAFAYIRPTTFEIYPMRNIGTNTLQQISNLKRKAPGLKILSLLLWFADMLVQWVALGGWTFSDNGTDTQPVWSDLSSTPAKRQTFIGQLMKFMNYWGFDGVDLDWEYPGAPDRMGKKEDGQNLVYLLEDIRIAFASKPSWGISFTAPTSYWYMRWFPMSQLYQHVDWINLMSYDLHGSWDSPESWIGSFVYAHTNLTEIKDALNLLWRNGVPANKVNLGIGFYGRSYTLSDPNCVTPGCAFSAPGRAGSCTGEGGVLSYAEIESMKKIYGYNPAFDRETAVKYFAFNEDQWVSYDDDETLQMKVDFAQEQGLLGLFIWSVDLDTKNHDALKALLGGKLGIFRDQNGIGSGIGGDDWESVANTKCFWSDCGNHACPPGSRKAGAEQFCKGPDQTQMLCCPQETTPDPSTCGWNLASGNDFICDGSCPTGKIPIITSSDPWFQGSHAHCFLGGEAPYCCDESNNPFSLNCWLDKNTCTGISNGLPTSNVCQGAKFASYGRGDCNPGRNSWSPVCCDEGVDTSDCYWADGNPALTCEGAQYCKANYVPLAEDNYGGGDYCRYTLYVPGAPFQDWHDADLTYCCPADALKRGTINLPVPLKNLFPTPGPESNKEKLGIEVSAKGNNQDPNKDGFGFFILSGPEDEVTSMNKRDGSHWELFNCPDKMSEERQTVQAVCTDKSSASNCDKIYQGGVQYTVVEMPDGCGPGSYAMAVSLDRSVNHTRLPKHLEKRDGIDRRIFDFTFDYDFDAVNKRQSTNVLMRIDFSDDPGYWDKVVARPGPQKRADKIEVETEHGGDYKRWIEHKWHREKRSMPHEEIKARWFSGVVSEWFDLQKEISIDHNIFRNNINDDLKWILIRQDLDCKPYGIDRMFFEAYVNMKLNAQAASGLTLIGTLGNLRSFEQSHVWFRSKGRVDVEFVFKALAKMSFHTGEIELFGAANFGSPFRVPGIVTIGPNFKIMGQLSGDATIELEHSDASYKIDVVNWDYSQRYPPKGITADADPVDQETQVEVPGFAGPKSNPVKWDLNAKGEIITRIIPKVTLGIVFDSDKVADAEVALGVDAWARIKASVDWGSTQDVKICYGSDGGLDLFAELRAPTMFGINPSRRQVIESWPFEILKYTCTAPSQKRDMSRWSDAPIFSEREVL